MKKCKKNAEKYAKEMHKNARTKMSKDEKGKKISKKEYVKGWNNGSALVLKLESHGFKSLIRAFVFSS